MASLPISAIGKIDRPSRSVCPTCSLPATDPGFVVRDGSREFCSDPFHENPAPRLEIVVAKAA